MKINARNQISKIRTNLSLKNILFPCSHKNIITTIHLNNNKSSNLSLINRYSGLDKKYLTAFNSRNFTTRKPIINQTNTNLHNHHRYDGLNEIKFNKYLQKEIVKRENDIFKNWKKLLNHYLNDWEKAVNLFSIKEKTDLGEVIGEYVYFEETTQEGYDILYRKNLKTNFKETVLDIKRIPFLKDINKTVLKSLRISPNQKKVSFIIDLENKERYTGGIYDIEKKEFYKCKLENVNCIEFTKYDNYYIVVENDDKNRPAKIKGIYLNIDNNNDIKDKGSNSENEVLLLEEKDHNVFLETAPSKDNKFLIINSLTKNDSAIYTLKLDELEARPIEILKRSKGIKYFTDHANGKFFILSNMIHLTKEKLEEKSIEDLMNHKLNDFVKNRNFKLFALDDKNLGPNAFDKLELIAHPESYEVFEDMDILNDHVVVYLKKTLVPGVLVHTISKNENKILTLDNIGEIKPRLNKDFNSNKVQFEFSNPYTFKNIYELELETKQIKLIDQNAFSNIKFNKSDYILDLLFAPAEDGELIPITLFHHKNIKLNRKNKLLLIGYGAYGLNLEVDFNSVFLAAAKQGWVIAYAHVRGGSEKGVEWHSDGKLLNKANSINDYLACVYHLIQKGYSHPNYIAGYGQSAGGIVVGQAANLKPELFRAVCLSHPFVDVLSTLLDDQLPLTVPDYEEFGNPIANRKDYFNIFSNSPYENISNQEYPAMYISMSSDDPRVPFWGVLKYIEKLRLKAKNPQRIPNFLEKNICVRIFNSGHFGPVNREESLKERIWEMMWLDKMLVEKDNILI